jgi:WD40 repeat protein
MAGRFGYGKRGRARTAVTLALIALVVACGCTTGRYHHHVLLPPVRAGTTTGLVVGFADPQQYVDSVAFGPDGKTVLTDSGPGGGISQWEWSSGTGQRLRNLGSPDHSLMTGLAVSADGRLVASVDQHQRTWVWNLATGKPVAVVAEPARHAVSGAAISSNDAMLATFDSGGMIYLWSIGAQAASATPEATLAVRSRDVRDVSFSPDGATLAASDVRGVELWDVATRRPAGSLTDPGNNGAGDYARYTPDGKRLVSIGSDIADVWDLAARKVIATLSNGATDSPADIAASLAVSPDGASVAVPYHDGPTVAYSAQTGRPTLTLTDPGPIGDRSDAMAAFSPDGTLIAVTTGVMGQVFIWNIKQAKGT